MPRYFPRLLAPTTIFDRGIYFCIAFQLCHTARASILDYHDLHWRQRYFTAARACVTAPLVCFSVRINRRTTRNDVRGCWSLAPGCGGHLFSLDRRSQGAHGVLLRRPSCCSESPRRYQRVALRPQVTLNESFVYHPTREYAQQRNQCVFDSCLFPVVRLSPPSAAHAPVPPG